MQVLSLNSFIEMHSAHEKWHQDKYEKRPLLQMLPRWKIEWKLMQDFHQWRRKKYCNVWRSFKLGKNSKFWNKWETTAGGDYRQLMRFLRLKRSFTGYFALVRSLFRALLIRSPTWLMDGKYIKILTNVLKLSSLTTAINP